MKIVNLTQHVATEDQRATGVIDLPESERADLVGMLTFRGIPSGSEVRTRARAIAEMAEGYDAAMIGGAPYLMPHLDTALRAMDIAPLYAFSERESVEETQPDGSVRKVAVFRHKGFVGLD